MTPFPHNPAIVYANAEIRLRQWFHAIYHVFNLDEDLDLLPDTTFDSGLNRAPSIILDRRYESCPVCSKLLTFQDDVLIPWGTTNTPAVGTPCGHRSCADCLRERRIVATDGRFTCPTCRAGAVCGHQACMFHVVVEEKARPFSMSILLETYFLDHESRFSPLIRLDLVGCRCLRGYSRLDLVDIAICDGALRDTSHTNAQLGSHRSARNAALARWQARVTTFF
jgi:hypothetical protein